MTDFGPIPADGYSRIWTVQDAVEHLLDRFGVPRSEPRHRRVAFRSVVTALREVCVGYPWRYFDRRLILTTSASYSTGTVAYVHSARSLTITDGTWPSWARYGRVILNSVHYHVEKRDSDTVLTLPEGSNPGANFSGTYTIYRDAYLLPDNFHSLGHVYDVDQRRALPLMTSGAQHAASVLVWDSPGTPDYATLQGSNEEYGRLALVLTPAPSSARNYDLRYQAAPRTPRVEKEAQGTVSVSGGTVTGTGTNFTSDHVGCILRVASASSREPTAPGGGVDDTEIVPAFTAIVQSVASTTSLTISNTTASASGARYTLSDPLDIEPHAMLTAVFRQAEYQFALGLGRKDDIVLCEPLALSAMRNALAADNRTVQAEQNIPVRTTFRRLPVTTD